jgi:hypothetical protein
MILVAAPRFTQASDTFAITQTVTGPTEGVVSSLVVREGASLNTGGMPGAAAKSSAAKGLPQLPVQDYGATRTRSRLLAEAKSFIVGDYPKAPGVSLAFVSSLRSFMAAKGVSSVAFNFNQKVSILGDAAPSYLVWSIVVDMGHIPRVADPRIVDKAPHILQVTYTPKATNKGLSSNRPNPNAGVLQWRKLDTTFMPMTEWTRVDVSGAYDDVGEGGDKDQGVKCLANREASPSCPTVTNVADLIKQTGAGQAVLDYSRAVQLVYQSVEDPPLSGKFQQTPRVGISVDYREWIPSSCGDGRYINRGTYGVELRNLVNRYVIEADGTNQQIDSFEISTLSPTGSFDVTKKGRLAATSLTDKVVDIKNPSGDLLPVSLLPNLVNLAPVITQPTSAGNTVVFGDYYYGDCGRAFGVVAQCQDNGDIRLIFGVSSAVPHCSPRESSFSQSQTYTLRKGKPIANQTTTVEEAGSFLWSYDGDRKVLFRHGDWASGGDQGGRPGMSLFASQVFFPNKGFYIRRNFPSGGPVDFYFEGKACPAGTVPGDRIFPHSSFWFDSYGDRCLRLDPKGALAGACVTLEEQRQCPRYSDAGPKVWAPTQQDPRLP